MATYNNLINEILRRGVATMSNGDHNKFEFATKLTRMTFPGAQSFLEPLVTRDVNPAFFAVPCGLEMSSTVVAGGCVLEPQALHLFATKGLIRPKVGFSTVVPLNRIQGEVTYRKGRSDTMEFFSIQLHDFPISLRFFDKATTEERVRFFIALLNGEIKWAAAFDD